MRKIAATLVALGLTLGLFGAGVSATFTDSASAKRFRDQYYKAFLADKPRWK